MVSSLSSATGLKDIYMDTRNGYLVVAKTSSPGLIRFKTATQQIDELYNGGGAPQTLSVDEDNGNVYWVNFEDNQHKVIKNPYGGSTVDLNISYSGEIRITQDLLHLYVLYPSENRIDKYKKSSLELVKSINTFNNPKEIVAGFDIDECCLGTFCHADSYCSNSHFSFSCKCKSGFYGNGTYCEDVNECNNGTCHPNATCSNTRGSFSCECRDGFIGDGRNCEATNCSVLFCGEKEMCVNVNNIYKCVCKSDYKGPDCSELVQATCKASGDPHYTTFDGSKYDFMGKCEYVLAKDSMNNSFEIRQVNEACNGGEVSCTKSLSVIFPELVLYLRRGSVMVNGSTVNFPYNYGGVNITQPSSGVTLVTSKYGVTIRWDNVYNVRVTVLGRYRNRTSGLCGTYNEMKNDDFLTSYNTTETKENVVKFGNSWKTDPSCENATEVENPCTTNRERAEIAKMNCSALLKYPFSACNGTVNATEEGYVQDCEYDMCACVINPTACLCESLESYATECKSYDVTINWRNMPQFAQCNSSCASAPCYNGGTCSNYGWTFKCDCPLGFAGERCEIKVSSCNDLSCNENEMCVMVGSTYQCVCNGDYEGDNCDDLVHATCKASGDPHYTTFDGSKYDFMGKCEYVLAKDSMYNWFEIREANEACNGGKVTCTKSISVIFPEMVIYLKRGSVTVNGSKVDLPVRYPGVNITEPSNDVTLVTSTYGVTIRWNNVYNVRVTVLGRYRNRTSGLCGTYNGMENDDFLTSYNTTETKENVVKFGNSWKTDPSCENATDVENPCTTNLERAEIAKKNCAALLKYPFWACNRTVNATEEGYVQDCEYDMCACDINPTACLCESFKAYTAQCYYHGVHINWIDKTGFEQCTTPCASAPCYNGGTCSNDGTMFKCHCPAGFIGERCDVKDMCKFPVLFYATSSEISYISSLNYSNSVKFLDSSEGDKEVDLAYDRSSGRLLYYNSTDSGSVFSIKIDGSYNKLVVTKGQIKRFTFDSQQQVIYYVHKLTSKIQFLNISNFDDHLIDALSSLQTVRDIDMDEKNRYLIAVSTGLPAIVRFNVNTQHVDTLLESANAAQTLSVDEYNNAVYWVDFNSGQNTHALMKTYYSGSTMNLNISYRGEIAITQDLLYLYVMDKDNDRIDKYKKTSLEKMKSFPVPADTKQIITVFDNDECCLGTFCPTNSSCSNSIGSFQCTCSEGFMANGTICQDIDECLSPVSVCHQNATCENTIGSFKCECHKGFKQDGQDCIVTNCSILACRSNELCMEIDGIHRCVCRQDYGGPNCDELVKATCSATGDPHYSTFDGTMYEFMGKCEYVLAKDSMYNWFEIKQVNEACGNGKVSCTKSVTVIFPNTTINLWRGSVGVNGTSVNLPVYGKGFNITGSTNGEIMMYSDYGVMVSWDNINNVRVTVLGRYLNKTSGLCGTFNKIKRDDFLTSTGTTETDAVDFGNSWKTDPSCANATTVEHPCKTYPERKWIAQKNCSALIRYPFSLCNQTVNATKYFVPNCEYDMCACKTNSIKCLCESFQAYAAECKSRGVAINWRNETQFSICNSSCASAPCYNGGTCLNVGTGFTCKCPSRFSGDRCEIKGTAFLEEYIFYSNTTHILYISCRFRTNRVILAAVNAVLQYHIPTRRLYFYDTSEQKIYSCNVDGSYKKLIYTSSDPLVGFVINEKNRDIYYWTSSSNNIYRVAYNETTRTIATNKFTQIRDIDIDSINQLLIVGVSNGQDLQSFNLQNDNISLIYTNNSILTDLSVDGFDKVIYWIRGKSLESRSELLRTTESGETMVIRSYNDSYGQLSVIQGEKYYYVLSFKYYRIYKYDKETDELLAILITVTSPDKMIIVPDIDECLAGYCHSNASCTNMPNSFNCSCNAGFYGNGTYCKDINECSDSNLCHPNATCHNVEGSFYCACKSGFEGNGTYCKDVDECSNSSSCHMNATCNNTIGSFMCNCHAGYTGNGKNCTNINECWPISPCGQNATCTDEPGSFRCDCNSGYYGNGTHCRDINECMNMSSCHYNATCNNTIGSFVCNCNYGFSGDGLNCTDIDECSPDNANCSPNGTCNNTIGSFTCDCKEGFSGDGVNCTDIDECQIGSCHQNATCNNTLGSFDCHCYDGFTGDGKNCTDIIDCDNPNACHPNATCMDIPGSYMCMCKRGFTGNETSCEDINECSTVTCHPNATCNNTIGSFYCKCMEYFIGDGYDCTAYLQCTDNSSCDPNAWCNNITGTPVCKCNTGFFGNGSICNDTIECNATTYPCHANATCNNTFGSFECTCKEGFEGNGTHCQDIDECWRNSDKCHSNATCENTIGSYICHCDLGYTGNGTYCRDLDECLTNTTNCHANATCNNTVGSFKCYCEHGFSGNGTYCQDINECWAESDNCSHYATCNNTIGSFTCTCNEGFTGDGLNCTDINECWIGSHDCSHNATCNNTMGSFTCKCKDGFQGDGVNCTDIDECFTNADDCHGNATCYNTVGSFKCYCNNGFTGNGTYCKDIDECSIGNHTCSHNATCNNTVGSFNCTCKEGFGGDGMNCTDNDECSMDTDKCDVNARCNNTIGSYVCTCNTGFRGNGTYCKDVDECATYSDNCHNNATCNNTIGSFNCSCNVGFAGNGTYCDDIDECSGLNNCHDNATCNNSIGSHSCYCMNGFTGNGTYCRDVDECSTSADICHANSTCNNTIGSFMCHCNTGFISNGTYCQDNNECDNVSLCYANSTCNNTIGSFKCICNPGFTANGSRCEDVNECSTDICHANATCNNTIGSFMCHCNTGFIRNGTYCQDKDECLVSNMCQYNSTCTNTIGSFQCICDDGFTANGSQCQDINECNTLSHGCHVNATCTNTIGSHNCTCKDGFTGNGVSCNDINECSNANACHHNATCHNTIGSFSCSCNTGYTGNGSMCYDINECNSVPSPCHDNATCHNSNGSHTCICKTGFSGNGVQCQDIDECSAGKVCHSHAECVNTIGYFMCQCKTGYTGNGTYCKDIDECSGINMCSEDADCTNTDGSYVCNCKSGFSGDGLSCSDIDDCSLQSTCAPNTCENLYGSNRCVCPLGKLLISGACADVYVYQLKFVVLQGFPSINLLNPSSDSYLRSKRDIEYSVNKVFRNSAISNAYLEVHLQSFSSKDGGTYSVFNLFIKTAAPEINTNEENDPIEKAFIDSLTETSSNNVVKRYLDSKYVLSQSVNSTAFTPAINVVDYDECSLTASKCGVGQTCTNFPGTYRCHCNSPASLFVNEQCLNVITFQGTFTIINVVFNVVFNGQTFLERLVFIEQIEFQINLHYSQSSLRSSYVGCRVTDIRDGSVVVSYLANFNSSAQTTTENTAASAIQNELNSNGTGTFLGPYQLKGDKTTAITYTDYNECNPQTNVHIQDCGSNEICNNLEGTYTCTCGANYTGVPPDCEPIKIYPSGYFVPKDDMDMVKYLTLAILIYLVVCFFITIIVIIVLCATITSVKEHTPHGDAISLNDFDGSTIAAPSYRNRPAMEEYYHSL